MSSNSGYVYVLINPAVPDLVKIGKTTRSPEERVRELSSATGVPTPFILIYKMFFQDCAKGEEFVHEFLSNSRISNNREFFQVPNTDAINAVIKAKRKLDTAENIKSENLSTPAKTNDAMCEELLESASDYLYGAGETLKDEEEAYNLYKKAIKLGCTEAYSRFGDIHYEKYSYSETKSINDLKQAIKYYKECAQNGNAKCWGDLAICYGELEEYSNADKCWLNLLTNPSMKGKENELSSYLLSFMNYMGSDGRRKDHKLTMAIFSNPTFLGGGHGLKEKYEVLENFYQELKQGLEE